MRDDHGAACELEDSLFQCLQRFDVQVVRRFVEEQEVARLLQVLRHEHAVAFTTGELRKLLLLGCTREVEESTVGASIHLAVAHHNFVVAARDRFPNGLGIVEAVAALFHADDFDSFANLERTAIGLFRAHDHLEQSRFTSTVRTDNAHDARTRQAEVQIVEQHLFAKGLLQVFRLNNDVAQALAVCNVDLSHLDLFLGIFGQEFFVSLETGLALCLASLRALLDPFLFASEALLTVRFALFFVLHAFKLLVKPLGIIAFPRNAAAAVNFQNPVRHVVKEVTVMGHENHGALVFAEVAFEPSNRFGIEVVRRFVQEQQIRFFEEQAAKGHAALFTAGKVRYRPVTRRAAESVHGNFDIAVEAPQILSVDDVLELGLFVQKLVHFVVFHGLSELHGDFVEAVENGLLLGDGLHHVFLDGQVRVELRFLRQVARGTARFDPGFALEFLVDARHDAQQGRLTGTVLADDANLRPVIEAERNVLQHFLVGRIGLGHLVHVEDEFFCFVFGHRTIGVRGWNLGYC